jgi:glycosyltransferase involved in cell wall biosynthesis
MKILELTNTDFALRHFLLPLMRALRDRGHEVVGACADGPGAAAARDEGFRVEALPPMRSLNPLRLATAGLAIHRLLARDAFDVAHVHMPVPAVLGRIAARIARVPRVAYTSHGFLFNQPGPAWRRALSLLAERATGRLANIYMTVSEAEAEDARRLRLHPAPIAVGNGRDPAVFRFDPQARRQLRAEFEVPDGCCVIVAVARLTAHKGLLDLADAASRLVGNHQVWIVGERLPGEHGLDVRPALRAAEERFPGRFRLLGARADIPAILSAADVFCLPSHFEGLPMSVIEAMLVGLPVVGTDIKGVRELVVHGRTGFLAAPGAPIVLAWFLNELVDNPERRASFGAAGREIALSRYHERIVLKRVCEVIEEAAGSLSDPRLARNGRFWPA